VSSVLAILAVLAIIFVVPLAVYGAASGLGWVKLPQDSSPRTFMVGVLVTKAGTAAAFVVLLQVGGSAWVGRWLLYAAIWFVMFAASEIGDAVAGRSSWPEAALGVVAEAIYVPLSALAAYAILGIR